MIVTKLFDTSVKAEEGARSLVGDISTTSIDRDGDVVLPSGIDLDNFWKNPQVLFGHDASKMGIGTVKRGDITKTPVSIVAKAALFPRPPSLPSNVEWQPDTILDLAKMGAPLGLSIGFRIKPGGARIADERDAKRFGDGVQRIISKWELLEFSVVTIPANQDAMVTAVAKMAVGDWTKASLGLPANATIRIVPRKPKTLDIGKVTPIGTRLIMR
jgi:hypothetical protein